jgi:uncharacterized protein YkwD
MRGLLIISTCVALLAGCTSTGAPLDEAKNVCAPVPNEYELVSAVLTKINAAREADGLAPLKLDPLLSAVADEFACEMIQDDFLAHTDPKNKVSPGDRLTSAGYIYYAMGENLGAGQQTPDEIVNDWMASDAHRENILSEDWRETGIAVRRGGEYGWYWVQEFADPVEFASQ